MCAVLPACLLFGQSWASGDQLTEQISRLQAQTQRLQAEVAALKAQATKRSANRTKRKKVKGKIGVHGMRVIASPYIGMHSAMDGGDLLINSPTINQDLYLLQQKSGLLKRVGADYLNAPVIELSGKVEGLVTMYDKKHQHAASDISLGSAELNINAMASSWANAFMSVDYDPPVKNNIESSHVYIRRAFVTIGNLDRSPIYGSVGRMYVPFGVYSSGMVTSNVTSDLAEMDALSATLGYHKNGVTLVAYAFNGRPTSTTDHELNDWGLNANYEMQLMNQTQKVGVGYVSNLADGTNQANTFSTTVKGVQGLNINANIMFNKHINLIAEYIRALNRFKSTDFASTTTPLVNNAPKPTALDVELGYIFTNLMHPTNVYVAYNNTTDGANFGLPQNAYIAVVNTSWFKNTVQSLEYRHNHHFVSPDENVFSAQLGVYF